MNTTNALTLTPAADVAAIDLSSYEDLSALSDPEVRYSRFDSAGEITIDASTLLTDLMALANEKTLKHDPTSITMMLSTWLTGSSKRREPVFLEAGGMHNNVLSKAGRSEAMACVIGEADAGPTYAENCRRLNWRPTNRGITALVRVNVGTTIGFSSYDPGTDGITVAVFKVVGLHDTLPRALSQTIQATHAKLKDQKRKGNRRHSGLKASALKPMLANLELVALMHGTDGGLPSRYFPQLVDPDGNPVLNEEGEPQTTRDELSMYLRMEHALTAMAVRPNNAPTYIEMFRTEQNVSADDLPARYNPQGIENVITHHANDAYDFMPILSDLAEGIRKYRQDSAPEDQSRQAYNEDIPVLVTWTLTDVEIEGKEPEARLSLGIEFRVPIQGDWNRKRNTIDTTKADSVLRATVDLNAPYLPAELAVHTSLMHMAETLTTLKTRLRNDLGLGADGGSEVVIPMMCSVG